MGMHIQPALSRQRSCKILTRELLSKLQSQWEFSTLSLGTGRDQVSTASCGTGFQMLLLSCRNSIWKQGNHTWATCPETFQIPAVLKSMRRWRFSHRVSTLKRSRWLLYLGPCSPIPWKLRSWPFLMKCVFLFRFLNENTKGLQPLLVSKQPVSHI